MGCYAKEVLNKNSVRKVIQCIFIILFNIIINVPLFTYITWRFIGIISKPLFNNILDIKLNAPAVFPAGFSKVITIELLINIIILMTVEFLILFTFKKRLNNFFRTNLFTLNSIFIITLIPIFVQLLVLIYYWI